jgi:branched-chain amino acid transport system ATP-binding protein
MALLELNNVHTYYGNIHALKGISVTVDKGEVVTLIGSNGAGKTTTLKTISGVLRPKVGTITLDGRRIDRVPAHDIVAIGICQSPEGRRIFPRLTTLENLEMGAFHRSDKTGIQQDMERVFELFPRLKERRSQQGGTLEAIFQIIQDIHAQGITILLVEQNALMALQVASRGYVLQTGRIVLHDSAENLSENEMVRKAYLGET